MYKRKKQFWGQHWDFILLDLLAAELAFFLAVIIRFDGAIIFFDTFEFHALYENMAVMLVLIDLLGVTVNDTYSGIVRRNKYQEMTAALWHSIVNVAGMLLFMYAFRYSYNISRYALGYWGVGMVIITYIFRVTYKRALRKRILTKETKSPMLVLADSATIEHCIGQLSSAYFSFEVVGCVVLDEDWTGKEVQGIPVVGNSDTLFEYLRTNVVDEVFIDRKERYSEEVLVEQLTDLGVTVHVSMIHTEKLMQNPLTEYYGDYMTMTTSMRIASNREAFAKRAMDIMGALVGLILCAIAFIFVAPVIKIQAPGPIFFSQTRIGKNGRRFKFYKFRSMYVDAEKRKQELLEKNEMQGPIFKMEDDPRIFPAGRFIRKYSIDELPQFWNVLIGDMSLVGTRPPTEEEYDNYELHHKARLASRPGLTGLWQVSGRNNITDFEEVVALDTEYIKNWSLILDIKIIFRTIGVVFKASGSK